MVEAGTQAPMRAYKMKPKDFTPHRRIELEFGRSINALLNKYLSFPEGSTLDFVLRAFANLSKTPAVLNDIAFHLARRMVTMVKVSNARSWREVARQSSRGREIYAVLQKEMEGDTGRRINEIVAQNAQLISSIPGKVRETIDREIFQLQLKGERPETISAYLLKRVPQLTKSRAKLIARTETGKAATALTRARSEDLDIPWYQWATSEDERVRSSHHLMDKVLVSWTDPPNPENLAKIRNSHGPYNAGNIYNCRCDCYPVISLNTINWPARVYHSGSITRMTRRQFSEFSGIGRRVAA